MNLGYCDARIKGASKVIRTISNSLKEFLSRFHKVFKVIWHIGGGGGILTKYKKGEGLLSIPCIETWTRHMAPTKIEPMSILFPF
jgi:hypothetical protein